MFKLLTKYVKPYIGEALCVLLFVAFQVGSSLFLPTVTAWIVDVGLKNGDLPYIISRGAIMLLVSLGQVGAMIGIGFFSSRLSAKIGRDMRHDIFTNAETFSLNEMNGISVSSLIVRNTNDVTMLQNFTVMFMRMVLTAPVMCIGSVVLTLSINPNLSKVILISIPLLIMLFSFIIVSATKLIGIYRKKSDNLNRLIREHLSGTRVIRAFVNQKTEQAKFEEGNQDVYKVALKINRITSSMMPGLMMIINLTTVAVCWFGAVEVEAGGMEIGQLMSFIQYVTEILMSLAMLSMLMVILPRANVSAKRVNEVLNLKTAISDPEKPQQPAGDTEPGTVEFRDVTFSYPGGDVPVLQHISFTAQSGQTTAIVGSTGSGKSTLLSLMPRLYDVSEGQLLIDGLDVREFSLADLRSRMGFVPQKGVLFSGTIADNIRFGYPDASEEEIISALKTSQSWDFVSEKENGIEEMISQGGKNVSGGQKQRLSIARAIVRPCEIYVFDDSFSALDYATDSRLRAALAGDERLGKCTKIIVAQRVSTVMNADKIIVLDNGKVVGEGTHRELLENCKVYYEIAASQLSEEELKK